MSHQHPEFGGQPGFEADFLFNPAPEFRHCHCGTLLETGAGDLLACWYAYPSVETQGACLVVADRRQGQAWSRSRLILAPAALSVGNPVLFGDHSGRVWLLYVTLEGHYWDSASPYGVHSDDGGRTWAAPMMLRPKLPVMVRHPPLPLADGSLLLPAYSEKPPRAVLLRSRAPYEVWEECYRFDGCDLIQPVLIRRGPRKLGLYFRSAGESRQVWRSFSSDDGQGWSSPVRTSLPNPLSGIAAFFSHDRDTVVFNPTAKSRRRLALSCSADSGLTWSSPVTLDNSDVEVSYPSFIAGAGGRVHGIYTFNRRMMKYVAFPPEWWKVNGDEPHR